MHRKEVLQTLLYIVNNTSEVIPYLSTHKTIMKDKNPRQLEKWVLMEYNRIFMPWFKVEVFKDVATSKKLIWMKNGLMFDVLCCTVWHQQLFLLYKVFGWKKYSKK